MATQDSIRINPYWSVEQVAKALGVHARTVRRWIHRGDLPAVRVGGLLRIPDDAFHRFVNRCGAKARAAEAAE